MARSQADDQMFSDSALREELPKELLLSLEQSSGQQYLNALAIAALHSKCLDKIFTLYEPLIPELAARWTSNRNLGIEPLQVISSLARILPFAPYLKALTDEYLSNSQDDVLSMLSQSKQLALVTLNDESLHQLLLVVFRLLSYDPETFSRHVSPIQLQSLLTHPSRTVRFLAVRNFCLYMHAADSAKEDLLAKYLGDGEIEGQWDGIKIDYSFLSLWEEKRLRDVQIRLIRCRRDQDSGTTSLSTRFSRNDLSVSIANIAGILLPRSSSKVPQPSKLVYTNTTDSNLQKIASGLLLSKPLLVTGEAGSGKTCLILDIAREMGASSDMITLHLNEQTDAKMLIGTHVSTKPGSFSWLPGVLTRAVKDGRWLILEEIDRAPSEVLSVILPLLEKNELFIPSRKESYRAPPSFRIIATMRIAKNHTGEEILPPGRSKLGFRLFHLTHIQRQEATEIRTILQSTFPLLKAHISMIMSIFDEITGLLESSHVAESVFGRSFGLRDLMRFAHRINTSFRNLGLETGLEAIPESTHDDIFMHAVDCFAGSVSQDWLRSTMIQIISKGMQIAPQRAQYCLRERMPVMAERASEIQIGRSTISKAKLPEKALSLHRSASTFANTRHALQTLEQVSSAVQLGEALLLVGETGIGKTAVVQQLANMTGQKLTVINLSQQSESGDLLGGFKPVNIRSLAIPMAEEFEYLFNSTFSSKKNPKFLVTLSRNVVKGNWNRVVTFWEEGVRMAEGLLPNSDRNGQEQDTQPAKKRRLGDPAYLRLKNRWTRFSSSLKNLKLHVADGGAKFAFSFVEGRLVNAVRNGEWILLDEINLASPSTLETISTLFNGWNEERPFLLLSESGDVERIQAHDSFRIFAAMNPATDTGKRDLFSGIRSKFTEIYVHSPDRELKDLLHLINTYLGRLGDTDERATHDVAQVYMETQKMAADNNLTDGAGQKPHFSIRTLVRTLLYVIDHAPTYGLRRALYEGFSMCFLTLLSKESEQKLILLLDKCLLGKHKNVRSLLGQIPPAPQDGLEYVQFKHYWMTRGPLEPQEQPHYIITPFIERNLLNLVRATSTKRFPILLQGPTSSGKTSMIEYLAKISGHKFVRINNHEHTDLQEYLGSYATDEIGKLTFQEGVLVQALRKGYWVVLDELNLAPTDVLEALNRLLDDNRELLLPETQEVVIPHPSFMLFATQNPAGVYGGRKILSRAFRNRFLELHFDDIPEGELEFILQERSQIAPSFCKRIVEVYKRLSMLRQSNRLFEQKNSFATLRDLFRWALRQADNREQLAINGFMLLAERVRNPQEKLAVKKIIEEVMKVEIDETALYSDLQRSPFVSEYAHLSHDVVWTPAMRRLYVLVSAALVNDEPVLLIGETGCGKTQLCQTLSDSFGKRLEILNAHMNTEAGDLIGSQRPVRNRGLAEQELEYDLYALFKGLSVALPEGSLQQLISSYEALDDSVLSRCPHELLQRIRKNLLRTKSLFEWVDGALVNAMRAGNHFLFDEISLADDSVLERLNSVLEPNRSLLLAEKGFVDSLVVPAPGFQFLSTMNPGGDYGKRELSAALRNRLTEIWVPSLTNDGDILPILKTKIKFSCHPETAQIMIDFCRWFRETYFNLSSSISVRDLLAWVNFVNGTQHLEPQTAVIQGAAMVFIDTLGANPATVVASVIQDLDRERSKCLSKLGELLNCNAFAIYHVPVSVRLDNEYLSIGPFRVPRLHSNNRTTSFIFEAPATLQNSFRLIRAMQQPKPVLLEGSPGVGKTATIVALAQALGQSLTRINLSEQTDLTDLFGTDVPVGGEVGKFAWRDAPFLTAMQKGEWVLLDEMNLASQSILEGLNSCLDHRGTVYIAELDQTFRCHPGFRLFAAQNPHHQGNGRKGLPASFVNRFTVAFADAFKNVDFELICRTLFPEIDQKDLSKMIDFVGILNNSLVNERDFGTIGGPWEINLRDIIRWLKLMDATPGNRHPRKFLDIAVSQRFRTKSDREFVLQKFNEVFGDPNLQKSLFHNLSATFYQVGLGIRARHQHFQAAGGLDAGLASSCLPVLESLLLCVQFGWPCLLVGSSGSGKSHILKHLASMTGSRLAEISMNPEVDTMDLVGGFEQADIRRQSCTFLEDLRTYSKHRLLSVANKEGTTQEMHTTSRLIELAAAGCPLPDLLTPLEELADNALSSSYGEFAGTCRYLIRAIQESDKVQFEWIDGVLVEALQRGYWVVLDNANLCSASVLDRLNSLLEPGGNLVVNEKLDSDGNAQSVNPHPDFRIFLTMDPRNGELSRAMRNRAVEIFIPGPSEEQDASKPLLQYSCDSSVARFRSFQSMNWTGVPNNVLNSMFDTFLSYYSFLDRKALRKWAGSVCRGLVYLDGNQKQLFESAIERYLQYGPTDISEVADAFSSQLITYHAQVQRVMTGAEKDKFSQPMHPLVNEPYILSPSNQQQPSAGDLVSVLDLRREITTLLHLSSTTETLKSNDTPARGMLGVSSNARKLSLTVAFILSLQQVLDKIVGNLSHFVGAREMWSTPIRRAINYARDLYELTRLGIFPDGHLQVYLELGKSLSQDLENFGHRLQPVVISIRNGLMPLQVNFSLKTGLSMERIWEKWRPVTPASQSSFSAMLQIEDIANQLHSLAWRVSLPVSYLTRIWHLLIETRKMILSSRQGINPSSNELIDAVSKLEQTTEQDLHVSRPHFEMEFGIICQYNDLSGSQWQYEPPNRAASLLFAGRTSKLRDYSVKTVGDACGELSALFSMMVPSSIGQIISERLPLSVLRQVSSINQIALRDIERFEIEFRQFSSEFSLVIAEFQADQMTKLRTILVLLLKHLLVLHQDLLVLERLEEVFHQIRTHEQPETCSTVRKISSCFTPDAANSQNNVYCIAQDLLDPFLESIVLGCRGTIDQRARKLGLSWVYISLAWICLFVPDKVYDPSLKLLIQKQRYQRRKDDIQISLNSLVMTENHVTGQTSNLRSRLAENDLESLGPEPDDLDIYRPATSTLPDLQVEFDILLQTVFQSLYPKSKPQDDASMLRRFDQEDPLSLQEVTLLQDNLRQIRSRLEENYRQYDDIKIPVVWMLKCMDVGFDILRLDGYWKSQANASSSQTAYIKLIYDTSPYLGGTRQSMLKVTGDSLVHNMANVFDVCMRQLSSISISNAVGSHPLEVPQNRSLLFDSLQKLYQDWKAQLKDDQEKEAIKSRTFYYRQRDEQRSADEMEILEIFPVFGDETSSTNVLSPTPTISAREKAIKVADLLQQIVGNSKDVQSTLHAYVIDSASEIGRLWATLPDGTYLPTKDLISGVILALDDVSRGIGSASTKAQTYDFYADQNLGEVKSLFQIIKSAKHRFKEISSSWPDHATPREVLACCSELLAFKHTEPIAKFLTKSEKLHSFIYQWQSVASKEFSAILVYDQLTALLISWRRLELSTWAALLDREDRKAEDDAKSWWFIAYESVIAMPLQLISSDGVLDDYPDILVSTLESFFATTPQGQFKSRLQLTCHLVVTLDQIRKDIPEISTVYVAVQHFVSYYSRYEAAVSANIMDERLKLEKALKEQIQLASWKDTNISALRDSARRSHHNLFKIIRKYRTLLEMPVSLSAIQVDAEILDKMDQKQLDLNPFLADKYSIQLCLGSTDIWAQRPVRFQSPERTSSNMLSLYRSFLPEFLPTTQISAFISDIIETSRNLKKQTPTSLTEENKELVTYLKTQKKRFFAETLKELRKMGVKTNLGTDLLSKQNSLAKILSSTQLLTSYGQYMDTEATEAYFHKFVEQVLQARLATRDHSDELATHEVARGTGIVEGLLFLIRRQRSIIAPGLSALDVLVYSLKCMETLVPSPSKYLSFANEEISRSHESIQDCVRWLPEIIELGMTVISIHTRFRQVDSADLLGALGEYKSKFCRLSEIIRQLPLIPAGITTSPISEVYSAAASSLNDFNSALDQWIVSFPLAAFALKQMKMWTSYDRTVEKSELEIDGGDFSIADFDKPWIGMMDTVLICIQGLQDISTGFPSSLDDPQWLIRHDKSYVASINALRLPETNSRIRSILDTVRQVGSGVGSHDKANLLGAFVAATLPIIRQYHNICQDLLVRYISLHREICKMAFILTKTFVQICKEGYCDPADESKGEQGNTGKLESGTGLGEGEGAQDFSKDVQDDEDLTDIAQEPDKSPHREEVTDEKDAVNMNMEEMEGEMGEGSEKNGEDEHGDSEDEVDENDVDDEVGSVDELDSSMVDEKLWDGDGKPEDKQSENQKGKGSSKDEDLASREGRSEVQEKADNNEGEEIEDEEATGEEETEEVGREEPGAINPQTTEEETLDLPDEMQLDGERKPDDDTDDENMDGLSDNLSDQMQDGEVEKQVEEGNSDSEAAADEVNQGNVDGQDYEETQTDNEPDETDTSCEDMAGGKDHDQGNNTDPSAPIQSTETGDGQDRGLDQKEGRTGKTNLDEAAQDTSKQPQQESISSEGRHGQKMTTSTTRGQGEENQQTPQAQAFKKLGDALQQWYRQQRQIENASGNSQAQEDTDMVGFDFEHLQNEDDAADTQALGAASEEQAHALDPTKALETSDEQQEFQLDEQETLEDVGRDAMETDTADGNLNNNNIEGIGTFVLSEKSKEMQRRPQDSFSESRETEPLDETSIHLSTVHITPQLEPLTSSSEASRLWNHYSHMTQSLSLTLTEQLRLILTPTLATKMRGDFRTGKRLNIKRIIPYIASQYRRDKIWMRRSVPSKRSYQIMLAIDDSQSMLESGSSGLAFQTLALVAKALSALEVGDICIVGFGNEPQVRVAHEFGKPFANEAGSSVFQHFSFQQTGTNVRRLVADSLSLFRDARAKAISTGTSSQADLWQLELIISDGICEDHDSIRRLVRQAQEERVMIVFVIVDNLTQASSSTGSPKSGTSIMDLTQATFEPREDGSPKLRIRRYLEDFPFLYYLVVRDVRELPSVLGSALKQWFGEVMGVA